MKTPRKAAPVPFEQVLKALLNTEKLFPPAYRERFSDIPVADLAQLKKIWASIDLKRRQSFVEDLEELLDSDTTVAFDGVARLALTDSDALIRAAGIRLLWESNEVDLPNVFCKMVTEDPDELVRANAASALGNYVFLGEIENLPKRVKNLVESALFKVIRSTDTPLVRRRALEALGYSSHEDVAGLIEEGFKKGENEWMASALFAMGRSGDERWMPLVQSMLNHSITTVQEEAVRAAGNLEMESACKPLMKMLLDSDGLDDDVRDAAIWSLSQIGGEGVKELLTKLQDESEDEDDAELIGMALDNLLLSNNEGGFSLLDLENMTEEELNHLIDLNAPADSDEDEDDLLLPGKN